MSTRSQRAGPHPTSFLTASKLSIGAALSRRCMQAPRQHTIRISNRLYMGLSMAESAAIEPGCEGGDGELDRSCTGRQSRLARVGKLRAEQRPKERTDK